jgi:excisionase family DNA binding protein
MSPARTALFVRLPKGQALALDRLADATGRAKQHLVSELLADRLESRQLAVGRIDVAARPCVDEVLTVDEAATLLKLSVNAVHSAAEEGHLPGRRFGSDWRFSREAVLAWLAQGEPAGRRKSR